MRTALFSPEGSGITIDPQQLEPKFLEAEQTLNQMIADHYIPGVDAITDELIFTGNATSTTKEEVFLKDVASTWDSLINDTFQESLMPSHGVVRNIFLAYGKIFDGYGENMRKLALKSAYPLNISTFSQIYQQSMEHDSDQNIADSLQRAYFEPNGNPADIFTTNSLIVKNLCITTIDCVYKECQRILAEGKAPAQAIVIDKPHKGKPAPDNLGMTPASPLIDELLPSSHLATADTFLIPNSRVANIFNEVIGASKTPVRVSSKSDKKSIAVMIDIALKDPNVITSGKYKITDYDKWVYSNISTIYADNGRDCIMTPATIFRKMHKMGESQYVSPRQLEEVEESVWKMQQVHATIDCTAQARDMKLIKKNETLVLDDDYLNIKYLTKARLNGGIVTTGRIYQLLSIPIIYQYSSLIDEVLSAPTSMADIRYSSGDRVPANKNRDLIFAYLLKRILLMKGNKEDKNDYITRKIALYGYTWGREYKEGLYDMIEPRPNRIEAKRIREYIAIVLDQWTIQNEIKGWGWYTKGRKIAGVEIHI